MALKLAVLFFTPLLAGLLIYLVPGRSSGNFKLLLVFAGAYLFSITVTHVLPELYLEFGQVNAIGLFVLAGFFLQQLLEYFSAGIEHGHIHAHSHSHTNHHGHHHKPVAAIVLLLALCVHAFLEGAMLAQPVTMSPVYDPHAILLGIALHRAPAAFALMAVLTHQIKRNTAVLYLLIFSLAAPAGLLLSSYFVETQVLTDSGLMYLYALVCGNFLHISTTIVFESSPDHHFNFRKLAVAVVGALAAVASGYLL